MLRKTLFFSAALVVLCGAWAPVGHRYGWWTPIEARSAIVPGAVLAALAAATYVPAGRLLRSAGRLLEQTSGEVLTVYVVAVGTAVGVAFLIAAH
jgi:hypothetical protein